MLVCVGDLVEELLVQLRGDPVRGGDTVVRSVRVRGGAAANVAALTAELGDPSRFVGQVGDDPIGAALVDDLEHRGVHTVVERAGATGVVVTMIGRGARSRLVDRATARHLSTIDPDVLDAAHQLFVAAGSFTLDPLATAIDHLLGEATERRIPVTLRGPTRAELDALGSDAFVALCSTLRPEQVILHRDEHEALGLGARVGLPGAGCTVITNGARPTLVVDGDGARAAEVAPVEGIRDRTGAGDGFVAGFLRARRAGADAVAAAHAGHRVAARVLRRVGPTTGAH